MSSRGRQSGRRGRGGGRGRGRGRGGGGGGGQRRDDRNGGPASIDRNNADFERYYNELDLVDDDEREDFWKVLKSDLPNSFRFAGSKGHALTVQKRLVDHYIPEITRVKYENEFVDPPYPIEWFPDRLAWAMTTPKQVIRKFKPFSSFQRFLVSETSVGNISRQEIVSMVPPLFMDIRPGMTVLDLCAAPGSKSAQLIEAIHGGEEARVRRVVKKMREETGRPASPDGREVEMEQDQAENETDYTDSGRSTGLLIANDADWRRAQMLVHQTKRLNSPNIIVTNHDATIYPSIKIAGSDRTYLKFDRILADVPCSGDGTVRKNPGIWKDWTAGNGLGLHSTQVKILVRSLQMLKVGGRVVYSTCSMNPIENEAVVAEAIKRCGGSEKVKLVKTDDALPGLKRRPGLDTWIVKDKSGKAWDSWQDVVAARAEHSEEQYNKVQESNFPPLPEDEIPLDRCIRIYAHLQDTGGFFVAVLEKQTEFKTRTDTAPKAAKADPKTGASKLEAIINEIDEKGGQGEKMPHLQSLDEIVPETGINAVAGAAPPAAWQGREDVPNSPKKRPAEDTEVQVDESVAPSKKAKLEGDGADPIPIIEGERQEHWPPPPGAETVIPEEPTKDDTAAPKEAAAPPAPAKAKPGPSNEEAFKYLDPSHAEIEAVYKFYQISDRFPRDRFMVRNVTGEPVKAIYYTSELIRDILTENEGKGIKFVHSGVKMFVKQDSSGNPDSCKWRIQTEGLSVIESWVGEKQVVRMHEPARLQALLKEMFPRIDDNNWSALGEVGEQAKEKSVGCCVLRAEPKLLDDSTVDPHGFQDRLVMPLWRGASSINLMLPKEDRKALLLRLFNDDSDLVDHSKTMKNAPQASKKREVEAAQTAKPEARAAEVRRERRNSSSDREMADAANEAALATEAAEQAAVKDEDAHMADAAQAKEDDREAYPGVNDEE